MGNRSDLDVKQGFQYRSVDETFPYTVDISGIISATPTSATGALFDVTANNTDVSTDVLSGTATISSTNITTESFTSGSLTAGHEYRFEVKFVANGETYEVRIPIRVEF